MAFLGALADQINNAYPLGQANTGGINQYLTGQGSVYNNLGDYAQQIDQSAERRYLEEGFLRNDPYTLTPKQFEVLFQEPNATVLVKKSQFSSINENYRPDFMDMDEKLFFKAMKILFQNKCQQIAVLEQLGKIQQITSAVGDVSTQLLPIIITLSDVLNGSLGSSGGGLSLLSSNQAGPDVSSFSGAVDRLRRLYAFNNSAAYTTWITDATNLFQSTFGQGTGVIELTNVMSFNTSTSVESIKNPGTFSFTISDPYQSMLITDYDIERALSDATNAFANNKVIQFSQQSGQQAINDAQTQLSQLRRARGASPINIITNPNTLINANQVIAIISGSGTQIQFQYNGGLLGIGAGVTVPAEYLEGGAIAGPDGLSTSTNNTAGIGPDSNIKPLFPQSELTVFQNLILAIYNQLTLENSTQSNYVANNKTTNYARRKLRFLFGGRVIVQPMDIVHFYINSKQRYDTRLLDGLQQMFSGQSILQNLGQQAFNLVNQATSLFNPSGNVQLQAEKTTFVGSQFPNYLWSLMRNQFVTEIEGTHVFAGLVETAPFQWNDGKFIVTVNGKDQTSYFDMGKVNWKPGVDVFNGAIFDPLTPFQTSFDTITSTAASQTPVLLYENQFLLGTSTDNTPPIAKFKLGPNVGQAVRQENIIQDTTVSQSTSALGKIFYAPDGLVYKWKEGIGTLVQFGDSTYINDPLLVGAPATTKEPFAGQDVMNVISLLITGQPYNFANYWRAVSNFDGFQNDPQTGRNSSYSYFDSLRTNLTANNATWGNFVPFKSLQIDEQSYAQALQGQVRAIQRNQDVDNKVKALANALAQVQIFGAAALLSTSPADQQAQFANIKLQAENTAAQLQSQLNAQITALQNSDTAKYNTLNSTGDASYDTGVFDSGNNPSDSLSNPSLRQVLRRELNFLTRRMSYNVRSNTDKNLFIVEDYYDKDYDILAYEQSLADGIKLYNNEFNSVREKIALTADLLNLEVFSDSQGHIRVRPPQYNKMPSSVFYRMMWLNQVYGIQVYPQFLEDMFTNQIKSLTTRVEVLENEIRLSCASLGYNTDQACIQFIYAYGQKLSQGGTFYFISDPNSFRITDTSALFTASNPDQTVIAIQNQANGNNVAFNNTSRYNAVLASISTQKLANGGYGIMDVPSYANNPRINQLIQVIQTDTGQQIPRDNYIVTNSYQDNGFSIPAGQSIDVFKILNDLSGYISNRSQALKQLYNAYKNATQAASLNTGSLTNSTTTPLQVPGVYGNQNIPETFECMIEDETYDDYGYGSGSRYVIKRPQIRNVSLAENPPDYTYIEVHGVLNPYAPNALPNDLTSFPQGGNGLVTAAAVDYDMWRKFGFRQVAPVNVPFLSDPNTQCAPYASMLLSRARMNILRGTVTISGNEFQQPGEVIFLEDYQMLFYVNSVRHSFTYASGFTTTLDLSYGHTIGEYIPTTLDVIGKLIYSNRDIANLTVQRQSNSGNCTNLGIVVCDPNDPTGQAVISTGDASTSYITAYATTNAASINNIIFTASGAISNNNTAGNNINATVELRIYYDDNDPLSSDLMTFANKVKSYLTSPQTGPTQPVQAATSANQNPVINPASAVVIVPVNMSPDSQGNSTNFDSPSQRALDMARTMTQVNSANMGTAGPLTPLQNVKNNLFNYIVDAWLVNAPTPGSGTSSQ